MNRQQTQGNSFEQRLLARLKAVVAEREAEQAALARSEAARSELSAPHPPRHRGRRLALGAAVAVSVVVAALLIISAGRDNTPKAFAVEPHKGGGVTIKIYSPEDSAGLEGALAEAGIRSQVTWLPSGMTCREPRFTRSTAKTSMGGTIGGMRWGGPGEAMKIGVMSPQRTRELSRKYHRGEISEAEFHNLTPNISLDPASFRPDQTVVISGSRGPYDGNPEGGFEAEIRIAKGPVGPCEPVRLRHGGLLGSINRVLESESAPRNSKVRAAERVGSARPSR